MDSFNRKSALNAFIHELTLKDAPKEFIAAITCFLDDSVAEKAVAFLKAEE